MAFVPKPDQSKMQHQGTYASLVLQTHTSLTLILVIFSGGYSSLNPPPFGLLHEYSSNDVFVRLICAASWPLCVCVCVLDETGREGGVKQLVISIWPNLQLENSRGHECSSIGKLFSLSWHSASMVNLQGHKKLHLDPPTLQFLQ